MQGETEAYWLPGAAGIEVVHASSRFSRAMQHVDAHLTRLLAVRNREDRQQAIPHEFKYFAAAVDNRTKSPLFLIAPIERLRLKR